MARLSLFGWDDVEGATREFNSSGAIVVVAQTVPEARETLAKVCPPECGALVTEPDWIFELSQRDEGVIQAYLNDFCKVFPDRCC